MDKREKITVDLAKETLHNNGYFIESLWHIEDVKSQFDCTDKEAMEVLNSVLKNPYIIQEINSHIREIGIQNKLKEK